LGDFTPKWGAVSTRPPKGTVYLLGNTSYDVLIVKVGPPVRTQREPKYKVKKVAYCPKSCIGGDHPRCHTTQRHGFECHTRDVVIYSKFHWNSFIGGSGSRKSKFGHSHLLWLMAFTTACTSRDRRFHDSCSTVQYHCCI